MRAPTSGRSAVCVFEMLTGRRPFDGETITDVLGAIVHKEPEWTTLPAGTPERLRRMLQRCLAKDTKQRLHNIADVRLEIEDCSLRARSARRGCGACASRQAIRRFDGREKAWRGRSPRSR